MKPVITNLSDYSNIGLNEESIDIKFSTGNFIRLFLDRDKRTLRLVVDDELIENAEQTDIFDRILKLNSFYRG